MSELAQKTEWLSREEKKIIRSQFFPANATDQEMQFCMGVAKALKLNPILKQIYFVPRRANVNGQWVEKVEPLAGRDAFLTIAHRSGKFNGLESSVALEEKPIFINGKWSTVEDMVATAKCYVKGSDIPFIVSVHYSEYVQTKKDGSPTSFWATKPITMLKKVAESQVLRKAFNISGILAEEEINDFDVKKDYQNAPTIDIDAKEEINIKEEIEDANVVSNEQAELDMGF